MSTPKKFFPFFFSHFKFCINLQKVHPVRIWQSRKSAHLYLARVVIREFSLPRQKLGPFLSVALASSSSLYPLPFLPTAVKLIKGRSLLPLFG